MAGLQRCRPVFFTLIINEPRIWKQQNKKTTKDKKRLLLTVHLTCRWKPLWRAWTDTGSLKKWWGPKDFHCTSCTLDFRLEGSCYANMVDGNGKETWSINVYKEIVPGKKIVMTDNFADSKGNIISPAQAGMPGDWGKQMLITLEFEDKGDKSGLKLRHEGISSSMHNECIRSWQECLDKLDKLK